MICPECGVEFKGGRFSSRDGQHGRFVAMRECPNEHKFAEPLRVRVDKRDADIASLRAELAQVKAALTEARTWIGDGENGDGLHRDHWTKQYKAAVDLVDAALRGPP